MRLTPKLAVAACLIVLIVATFGILALRRTGRSAALVADPAVILTATGAEDGGTEPTALPTAPVLKNTSSDPNRLAVDFGFKVGATAYAYRLGLAFGRDADQGTMDLGTPRGAFDDLDQFPVTRRWSDSRKAYLVAVTHDLATKAPAVPSLCVRAVIGPSKASLDLQEASLCVMQRDRDGRCHPASLACGLIR